MQVVGATDPMAVGGRAMALPGNGVHGGPRAVADALAEPPEVLHSAHTSGGFGLFAEVVTPGPKELSDFVNDAVPVLRDPRPPVPLGRRLTRPAPRV